MVHCHCAHSHDCIDHWFFDQQGNIRWGGEFLVKYNRDQYPTHSLGPVLSWLDINCGDAYATITSTATDSRAINAYFARKFGPDHPNAKREYKQGDIVTSTVRTQRGKSIVINYDMQLPRPYDNRWMVQGLMGLYDEDQAKVYIDGKSPKYHEWEPFDSYQKEYDHRWWKELDKEAAEAGHGGTDYLELKMFLKAVREKGADTHRYLRFRNHEQHHPLIREIHCGRQQANRMPRFHPGRLEDEEALLRIGITRALYCFGLKRPVCRNRTQYSAVSPLFIMNVCVWWRTIKSFIPGRRVLSTVIMPSLGSLKTKRGPRSAAMTPNSTFGAGKSL